MISLAEIVESIITVPIALSMLMAAMPGPKYGVRNRREPSLDLSKFDMPDKDYLGRTEPTLGDIQ